ncbi:MAG: DUF4190 domain-containing protein [Marmoricola sp.]
MSTYPGENPQAPDDGQPADDTTEPTQPVGYWERQAAERAHEQAQPTPSDTTTPYPQNPYPFNPNPYAQQPSGPPSGQPPYGGQPAAGYQQPGQPPPYYYQTGPGVAPVQPPYGYTPLAPAHPQATLAMVLGLVGVVGAFFACGLTLVVSPFAWAVGQKAVKEIEASQGRLSGESQARTGMITGIIGTVLLVLAIIAVIGFVALLIVSGSTDSGGSDSSI